MNGCSVGEQHEMHTLEWRSLIRESNLVPAAVEEYASGRRRNGIILRACSTVTVTAQDDLE